ncbi:hypothetical protein ACFSQE_15285 [Vogesella fluminis]|uniref:hypothetical protein n=1 Tax=Vogesella fluminis TaxID=1069161 RepID=UPI00167C1637
MLHHELACTLTSGFGQVKPVFKKYALLACFKWQAIDFNGFIDFCMAVGQLAMIAPWGFARGCRR